MMRTRRNPTSFSLAKQIIYAHKQSELNVTRFIEPTASGRSA